MNNAKHPTVPITDKILIAQTDTRNTVGVPVESKPQANNELLLGGGLVIGGAAVWAAIAKLLERFGTNVIDNQKSRISLELRERELELEAEKASKMAIIESEKVKEDLIRSTLNTALSNVYQGAREAREAYYPLLAEIEKNNDAAEQGFNEIANRLDDQDKRLDLIELTLRDLLAVLQMRERQNK